LFFLSFDSGDFCFARSPIQQSTVCFLDVFVFVDQMLVSAGDKLKALKKLFGTP